MIDSTDTTTVSTSAFTRADPATAFDVFTARIDTWWNPDHHVIGGTLHAMGIEPFVGGRLWDENTDGETCTWGRVLAWEPPTTFAFSWLIGSDWAIPADDAPASRVTVTFAPEAGGTRVHLVHDRLDAHGDGWQSVRDGVGSPGGWPGGMAAFAAAADLAQSREHPAG
jgi:uncharacterized protein YndB with AHSA1/START domain